MSKIEFIILVIIFIIGYSYISIENKINLISRLNVDELLWTKRSYNYISFFKTFDYISALQTIHPGITVMLFSGLSLCLADYLFNVHNSSIAFSAPIMVFIVVFYFIFYEILRKLKFNFIISFVVLIFFSMKWFYIMNTTPTDKYLAISLLPSLGLLLVYVNEGYKNKKYLYIASFFAAFSVLSKLSALILIPYSIFILFYYAAVIEKKYSIVIKDFFRYIFSFILFVVLIFPGFLFNPCGTVGKILILGIIS